MEYCFDRVPRPLSDFDQFLEGDTAFVLDNEAMTHSVLRPVVHHRLSAVGSSDEEEEERKEKNKEKDKKGKKSEKDKVVPIDIKKTVFFVPIKAKNKTKWLLVRYPIIQLYTPAKVQTEAFSADCQLFTDYNTITIVEDGKERKFQIKVTKNKLREILNVSCENPVVKFFMIQNIIESEQLIPCYNNSEFFVGFLFSSEFLLSLVNWSVPNDKSFFCSWCTASTCDFERIWRRLISDEMNRTSKPEKFFKEQSFAKLCCEALLDCDPSVRTFALSVLQSKDSMVKPYIDGLAKTPFVQLVKACASIVFSQAVESYGSEEAGRTALSMFWFRAGILPFASGIKVDDGLIRLVSFKLIGVSIENVTAYHDYLMSYRHVPSYVESKYDIENFEAAVELFNKVSGDAATVIETAKNVVPL